MLPQRKRTALLFLAALSVLVVTHAAQAQDVGDLNAMSLEDLLNVKIEVSSTTGEDVFASTATVSVIDAETIRQYHFTSVAEALQTVAGFSVTRTYLKRGLPTSRNILQDHYANKVLVMIGGTPAWNAVTGEAALDRIDIRDVERIEVLKGPASVLYGTNAYSGAVNIVLKDQAREKPLATHMGLGSYASYDAGASYLLDREDGSIFVSGHLASSTGKPFAFTDETGLTGDYREFVNANTFTVAARLKAHRFLFNGFASEESFLGVVPQFYGGAGRSQVSKGYLVDYAYRPRLSDRVDLEFGTTADWNQRDFPRTIDDSIRANVEGMRVMGYAKSHVRLHSAVTLEAGASYDRRTSIAYANYDGWSGTTLVENNMKDRSVGEVAAFGQVGFQHRALNALVGTRFTYNDLFGSNVSARGTLVYRIGERNSVKFIYGQSFRAPSLFELYFETPTRTVFGNTELQPETSNSFELAYLTSFDRLFVQVQGYYSLYDDKIFRDRRDVVRDGAVLPKKSVYVNGERFRARGLEVELKYVAPGRLNAFLNYAFADGDNGDEIGGNGNYNFKYVAPHTVTGGVSKVLGGFRTSVLAHYVSSSDGPLARIDAQYFVDANVSFTQKLQNIELQHTVFAKNLLDEDLQVPEYVSRKNLNSLTLGTGRTIGYALRFRL